MLESFDGNQFEYTKVSADEQAKRHILGRLVGPIADFKHPSRNGRSYSENLWDNVFNDPLMKEKIENRLVLGELGHPADRDEIDMEKVAVCLAEQPKKSKDGKLFGVFDILDTPNGHILKTLCDYGCKVGISSRGAGDIIDEYSDEPKVDPDTYRCECWDVVLMPGIKDARLTPVTEGLSTKKTLNEALNEQLTKAKPEDKKIMSETLKDLNLGYTPEKDIDNKSELAANDVGANMVKELQESLLANKKLEAQITALQEKLSVCYAKESKYEEEIARYKGAVKSLSESVCNVKSLQSKLNSLNEQLKERDLSLEQEQSKQKKVLEQFQVKMSRERQLNEALTRKANEVSIANRKVAELTESLNTLNKAHKEEIEKLNENLADVKKDLSIKASEYNTKLTRSNKLIEQYRDTAVKAVDRYIESKAVLLGMSSQEIKNRLPESYSFDDIDSICESLSAYKINVGKLPFELTKNTKIAIKESKDPILPKNIDDQVDDQLLNLVGLK